MNPSILTSPCPVCKTGSLDEALEDETFPYGDQRDLISLAVPVIRCFSCDFAYTDERAERARHAAVCRHMGLLSPDEIKRIRTSVLGMTREAFHAAFGLSAASVERWENGKLFQNESADTLIRLLADSEIAKRVDRRTAPPIQPIPIVETDNVVWLRFPSLAKLPSRAEDAHARSKEFNLRIKA